MNVPRPRPDWALFLDFDGTIVDFAPRPDAIRPAPGLVSVLGRAAEALGGALAVVTGRPVGEIDHWLASSVAAVAGIHGAERRRADGGLASASSSIRLAAPPPGEVARARARLAEVADAHAGVVFEDKGCAFVLHFRAAPERRRTCVEAVKALESAAFEVLAGASVSELRPRGVHKGAAIEAFMDEPPFAGRTPAFVGDDVTDEDGFRAVNAMGGVSVLAGPVRATGARHRIPDVASVVAWLRDIPEAVAS